jgi:hypothetical protein
VEKKQERGIERNIEREGESEIENKNIKRGAVAKLPNCQFTKLLNYKMASVAAQGR